MKKNQTTLNTAKKTLGDEKLAERKLATTSAEALNGKTVESLTPAEEKNLIKLLCMKIGILDTQGKFK